MVNFKYYMIMAALGVIVFIWSMIQFGVSLDQIRGTLISLSNTYGTFLVILLMVGLIYITDM